MKKIAVLTCAAIAVGAGIIAQGFHRFYGPVAISAMKASEQLSLRDAINADEQSAMQVLHNEAEIPAAESLPITPQSIAPVPVQQLESDVPVPVTSGRTRWFPDYSGQDSPPLIFYNEYEKDAPVFNAPNDGAGNELTTFVPEKLVLDPRSEYFRELGNSIQVPAPKLAEVASLTREIEAARSYEEAVGLLRRYLSDTGIIQHFKKLSLVHRSKVGPEIVLKNGLLSSGEQYARGLTAFRWADPVAIRIGDGIYFTGNGWDSLSDYGGYKYFVNLRDVDLYNFTYATEGFFNIYSSIRYFWHKGLGADVTSPDGNEFPVDMYSDLGYNAVEVTQKNSMIVVRSPIIAPDSIISVMLCKLDESTGQEDCRSVAKP